MLNPRTELRLPRVSKIHLQWAHVGDLLATYGPEDPICLWNAAQGTLRRTYGNESRGAGALAFSPDGNRFASTNASGMVTLWDCDSGEYMPISEDGMFPNLASWSPDATLLASAMPGNEVAIWDSYGGTPVRSFEIDSPVSAFAWSSDCSSLAFAAGTDPVRVWKRPAHSCRKLDVPTGKSCLAWGPGDGELTVGFDDGRIEIWNLKAAPFVRQSLSGHHGIVVGVACSPDGQWVASRGMDNRLTIWSAADGIAQQTLLEDTGPSGSGLLFHPHRPWLASANRELRRVQIWDYAAGGAREPTPRQRSINVFVSYASEDKQDVRGFMKHLQPLVEQGLIRAFRDRMIEPGEDWEVAIREQLEAAHLILLMVSIDFLNKPYCVLETKRALERWQSREATVIPVLLRHVNWATCPFQQIQAVPYRNDDFLPIELWPSRDEGYAAVAAVVRAHVSRIRTRSDT